jgi:hypothetical protein
MSSTYFEEGPQEPPPDAPAGYNWYTSVSLSVGAWWNIGPADEGSPVSAWAQTAVNYNGTDLLARQTLNVMKGNDVVATHTDETEESSVFPASRGAFITSTIPVGDTCDLVAKAYSTASVWNRALVTGNWIQWGKKTRTDHSNTARQNPCQVSPWYGDGHGGPYEDYFGTYTEQRGEMWWECDYADHWHSNNSGQTWIYDGREYLGCHTTIYYT